MKPITSILFLALLVGFTACKKNSTVVIQAQNYDNLSDGSAYAGVRFQILEIKYLLFGESKSKVVVDDYLDNNGQATFDLKMKSNKDYVLNFENTDHICYSTFQNQFFLDHENNNNVTFQYLSCGELSIPSKNVNCEGEDDKMQYKYYFSADPDIYIYTGYTIGSNHLWDDVLFIEGCVDYTNVQPPAIYSRPSGNYTIEWRVIRPSGTTTGIDYFTVNENDTTTYVLEY